MEGGKSGKKEFEGRTLSSKKPDFGDLTYILQKEKKFSAAPAVRGAQQEPEEERKRSEFDQIRESNKGQSTSIESRFKVRKKDTLS